MVRIPFVLDVVRRGKIVTPAQANRFHETSRPAHRANIEEGVSRLAHSAARAKVFIALHLFAYVSLLLNAVVSRILAVATASSVHGRTRHSFIESGRMGGQEVPLRMCSQASAPAMPRRSRERAWCERQRARRARDGSEGTLAVVHARLKGGGT